MSSDVPENWSRTTLGSVCVVKARIGWRGLAAKEYTNTGAFLIAGKHIRAGEIDWNACDHIGDDRYEESPEIALRNGDVIFSKDGSIGNPALLRALPGRATINGTMMMLRPDQARIHPEFLFQFVSGPAFARMIAEKVSGSSIPHIFQRDIVHFPTLLPPVDEQQRIAEVLRSVDEAAGRAKAAADQARRVVNGMLQRIFIEGIGQTDFKEGHSTSIPVSWNEMALGDLSTVPITYGVVQPGPNVAEGIPFVRGGDFPDGKINLSALRRIGNDVASQYRRTQLRGGEIVVSLVGYPGACAIVPDALIGANIARQAALIRPAEGIAARYLYQFLRSPIGQARLKKETIGSAQQVINLRDLKSVIVAVPPIREQEQIADVLADLDAFVELETTNWNQLTALKTHLMSDLVSGRVRVSA